MSVPARRVAVSYATGRGLSQRRACTLIGVVRSGLGYRSRMAAKDAAVLAPMARLAGQYPHYSYCRIAIFLRREGHAMGFGRAAYRLWRRARLQRAGETAAQARRLRPAAPECAGWRQPDVELRLRDRLVHA